MRNTVKLVVLMLLFSTAINAQNSPNKRADFAPKQQATLQTKRMALNFDLDKNQENAVYKMMLNKAEERESIRNKRQLKRKKGTTLTQEERFEIENNRLDRQLAHKEEMKKILTAEQFEKWNNFKNCNKHFSKNKHQKRREGELQ
jgi:periplasmic protein CpxP/Spy